MLAHANTPIRLVGRQPFVGLLVALFRLSVPVVKELDIVDSVDYRPGEYHFATSTTHPIGVKDNVWRVYLVIPAKHGGVI